MKVLSGAQRPTRGTMTLAGEPYAPRRPAGSPAARRRDDLPGAHALRRISPWRENIVLGREPQRRGVVDRAAVRGEAERALAWLDQSELAPDRRVGSLAPGARQLVEIARALAGDARVVVMDEPTSSLSRPEAERLFEVIDRLRARSVASSTSATSSKRFGVWPIATRCCATAGAWTAARSGGPGEEGLVSRILEAMAGRRLDETYPRVPHEPGEPVLELDEVTGMRLPRSRPPGAAPRRDPRHGGARRRRPDRVAARGVRARSGRSGRTAWRRSATAACRHGRGFAQGVGLLSEDRKDEGLALGPSVADNITLSSPAGARSASSRGATRDAAAVALGARLSLRTRGSWQPVAESVGRQPAEGRAGAAAASRRGRAAARRADARHRRGSKAEIYRLMGELAARAKRCCSSAATCRSCSACATGSP